MHSSMRMAAAILMLIVIIDCAEYENTGSVEPFSFQVFLS